MVQIIYLLVPFIPIIIMYIAIISVITRTNNYCKQVLMNSTVIIFTSLIAFLPATITNAVELPMSFEFAQIATVTFYYLNVVVNPLVYFCMHPRARSAVKEWLSHIRGSVYDRFQFLCENVANCTTAIYLDSTKRFRSIWYHIIMYLSTSKNSVDADCE